MDETEWEAELQVRALGNAAERRLLETALLLVAQSPPGERRFPSTVASVEGCIREIEDRLLVEVSVVEKASSVRKDRFHLWIVPNGDGSLRFELVSGKSPGFEYDYVMNLWADGEVFGQEGSAEVDMEEIRAEEQRAKELFESQESGGHPNA